MLKMAQGYRSVILKLHHVLKSHKGHFKNTDAGLIPDKRTDLVDVG